MRHASGKVFEKDSVEFHLFFLQKVGIWTLLYLELCRLLTDMDSLVHDSIILHNRFSSSVTSRSVACWTGAVGG